MRERVVNFWLIYLCAHRCVRTASGSDPIRPQLEWSVPSLPLRVLTRRPRRIRSNKVSDLHLIGLPAYVLFKLFGGAVCGAHENTRISRE